MGQYLSNACVALTNIDEHSMTSDEAIKLERTLRGISKTADETNIISEWEKVIQKKVKTSLDRWRLASFAIRILEKWGKYKLMLTFSVYQIELSHEVNKTNNANEKSKQKEVNGAVVLADSYLNLARANLALSQYKKALDYVRKSMATIVENRGCNVLTNRLTGYVYLYKGRALLGLSCFKDALENFDKSLSVAHGHDDKTLECLICCAMSSLYVQIKDYEKAVFFSLKASHVLQEHGKEWNKCYLPLVQLSLAEAYRKSGKLDEAMNTAENAMQVAIENQDRGSQSYSMLCFADIHRVRKDTDRAIPRYDSASGMMMETGDQFGNALVALGKAKAFFRANAVSRSLAEYETSLKIAECIQNKILCMRVFGEMTVLYQRISQPDLARRCTLRYHQMIESMELFCRICENPIAEKHEQLEPLPCSHLFHSRCVLKHGVHLLGQLACPACRRQVMKENSV